MAPKSCAIGIDLGTANTRFAIYRHDRFEVIPHEGQSMMPSYVAFTETGRLIGQAAKNQAGLNPKNTIFDAVRFVGPAFQDSYIQELTTWLPFTITHDGAEVEAKRKPVFEVMYKGELTIFTPVEILAMIVKRVRKEAEEYLGHPVVDAVVTIPAHFNISQRFAIKDALSIAGINALGIYHAPAVAVSDLTITQKMNQMQNVLICDIGAVHYDVVLATAEDGIVQVEAVCGDMNHAGYDYDRRLIHYMINCFRRATKKDFGDEGMVDRNDITNNPRALRRLSTACKKAKHQLSSADMAIIEIEQLHDGKDLNESITRVKFEELILDHIRFLLEPIERLLRDAKLSKSEIHQIHLIGGSSRIPKTQKIISDFFDGKTALRCLNIEETLARGAAIHASILSGDTTSKTATEILLLDAASQSLGIQTNDGIIKPLIKRGCTLPNIKQEVFSTSQDNQESFSVTCYEGDGAHMRDNMKLGYAQISIPPAPRGVPQLAVRFDIDARYNLEVSISEKGTGKKSLVKMDGYNSQGFDRISKSELQRLILAEEQMEAEDHLEEMRIEARNTTEELAYNIKDWIKCLTPARRCHSITNLETLTDQCFEWLDEHQFAPVSRYETVTRQLQELRLQAEKEQVAHESSYSRQELEQQESIIEESTKRNEETKKRHEGADSAQSEAKSDIIMSDAPDAGRKPELESKGPDFLLNGVAGKQDQAEAGLDEAASVPIVQTLEQSLSGTTPTAKRTLGNIGPARPDTTRTATRGMASLFDKPAKGGFTFTDTELVQISTYLKNTGQPDWSKVPRLYAILRLINELEMLDVFIQQGITDIWIPFAQTTLPRAMSPSAKANFLKHQEAVLSKSLLFEKSADKRHTRFLQGEPLPYEVVGKLGAGAHGQVDKVMSTVSHREYARKLFRRVRGMTRDAINSFLIELQVLKRVQHYHCIELVQSYTDPKYFALIMSPVGDCNLLDYYSVALNDTDKSSLLRSFFGCLANALEYIHSIKIRHRDIKPHNILVKGDRVLLADFGIALDWEELSRSTTTADSGKTWLYAAPEVANYEKRNTAADVWSLGCVFMEMATIIKGKPITTMRRFFEEAGGSYRFHANIPHLTSWADECRQLGSGKDNVIFDWVLRMLEENPKDRPTAATMHHDISVECARQGVPFSGTCCLENVESSGVEDEDMDDAWDIGGEEPTLMPGRVPEPA